MAKSQEIMRKIPDGYREATFAEEKELLLTGLGLQTWSAKAKMYEAQEEAAKLNLRNSLSSLQLASRQRAGLLTRLGLKDEVGYLLEDDGTILILTDPKKKIERLPPVTPAPSRKKGPKADSKGTLKK